MQLLGVYSRELVEPLAQVLANLGVKRGMVVCGGDGLDEATLTGPTHVCEIRFGQLSSYDMTPEATVTKLMWLLGTYSDYESIKKGFYTQINSDIMPM